MENNKNSLFTIIFIALIFGITGGIGGEIFARIFLLQDIYKVPLFGEINVPRNVYGGSNLIIESPKKVIVEQNTKVLETINSASKNIVGIFKKIDTDQVSTTTTFRLSDLYNINKAEGQGFVVTSDGWIMSDFAPSDLLDAYQTKASSSLEKFKKDFILNYEIIDSAGDVYSLLDIDFDSSELISFWRINANDLNVRRFENISDINKGQLVVATNLNGVVWMSTVSQKHESKQPLVLSSDKSYSEIVLTQDLPIDFGSGFLFNINGDLISLLSTDKVISPVSSYFSCLTCLLNKEAITHPYLGLNYINIDNFSNPNTAKSLGQGAMIYPNDKGIAIIENSPAEIAGLKKGDIIKAVNTIKINKKNTLSDLIATFKPGEKLSLKIERDEKEMQIIVTLSTLKQID